MKGFRDGSSYVYRGVRNKMIEKIFSRENAIFGSGELRAPEIVIKHYIYIISPTAADLILMKIFDRST